MRQLALAVCATPESAQNPCTRLSLWPTLDKAQKNHRARVWLALSAFSACQHNVTTVSLEKPVIDILWACYELDLVGLVCFLHHYPLFWRFEGCLARVKERGNSTTDRSFSSAVQLPASDLEMLQELSHMDRITQLQDEIQQVWTRNIAHWARNPYSGRLASYNHVKFHRVPHLTIQLSSS